MEMGEETIDKFVEANKKEESAFIRWGTLRGLSDAEADKILKDPKLRKRCLRSRCAYRDKRCGRPPLHAKCRTVAIGCNDPDLKDLNRSAPTVTKLAFFIVVQVFASGLLDPAGEWQLGSADVDAAFLQGKRQDNCRSGPIYLWPPRDPITSRAKTFGNKLYEVIGNMYGFADAPLIFLG